MPSVRALPWIAALSLLSVACSDRTIPVLPREAVPEGATPVAPVSASQSQSLVCHADVKSMHVECGDASPNLGSARGDIIVGGQNLYVKLTSSNLVYNSVTGGAFTFDVTVKNLIPQTMGTTDGTTSDGTGVNVFFQALPSATAGPGTITVSNPSGTNGAFTGSGQTYFNYPAAMLGADGILSQGETSTSKNWQFNVPNTVTTFSFALYVSANVVKPNGYLTLSPASASVLESGTQALTATVKSAVGNTITPTISWSSSNTAIATVASNGTITAVAPGTTTIMAKVAGVDSSTMTVRVCPNLSLGGVSVITGPTAASFCLAGGSGNEYVVVPYNGDPASTLGVSVTGTGIAAIAGAPTPYRAPSAPPANLSLFARTVDYSFERRLRASERQLAARLGRRRETVASIRASRGLRPGGMSRSITLGVPTVGTTMTLNVNGDSACSDSDDRVATVKSVGTHSIVLDENDNPSGGFSQTDFDGIAATFDTLVYPLITNTFGTPTDIDGNGRIVIVFSRAVNELTPTGAPNGYVGGFFFSRDLSSAASCATSNLGEMVYMLAPDPTGAVNSNVHTLADVQQLTIGTTAHELQHLINASRRKSITAGAAPNEELWLNEGLSHIAEELMYYHASGFSPRADLKDPDFRATQAELDAFNNYENQNFGRLFSHLTDPVHTAPLDTADNLGMRGAAWAFLRYAADRRGGTESTLWTALVRDATLTGTANVSAALGTSVTPWLRDFAAALYDDNLTGAPVNYTNPSWNFRSIFPLYGSGYPLAFVDPSSGVAYSPTLQLGGGASYLRMGVPASTFAPVTITKAGGGALPSTFSAMVIRRK